MTHVLYYKVVITKESIMENLGPRFANKSALKIANRVLKSLNQELKEKSIKLSVPVLQLMTNLERAKLELLSDGRYEITRYNDIAKYEHSRADTNIRLWYNTVSTQEELKEMIYGFVYECIQRKL